MEDNTIQKTLNDLSKKIWHIYVLNPEEEGIKFIISLLDDNLTLIGTGKHEFYESLEEFIMNLKKDQKESEQIDFKIIDEWYSCVKVTDETFIVYGTLWVIEKDYLEKDVYIEMDTRFTIVYKVTDDIIRLMHVHHSIPNFDQMKDEYYPKTIAEKAQEALAMAHEFKQKSEKDLMTGLYNRHFFEVHIKEMLETVSHGYFYIFDLDNFKQVNDIFGHIRGDEILIHFSEILTKIFINDAIIGRLGGDEFAVFEYGNQSKEDVENKAKKVLELCSSSNACSIGISRLENNLETFQSLYKQSDYALYYSKRNNKGSFSWF
ncbi:diguanylate cyclase [Clostridioides difficile]|nr:diguanylate cyclase [Clostridioides difficile]